MMHKYTVDCVSEQVWTLISIEIVWLLGIHFCVWGLEKMPVLVNGFLYRICQLIVLLNNFYSEVMDLTSKFSWDEQLFILCESCMTIFKCPRHTGTQPLNRTCERNCRKTVTRHATIRCWSSLLSWLLLAMLPTTHRSSCLPLQYLSELCPVCFGHYGV